jgi:hypothetical protein
MECDMQDQVQAPQEQPAQPGLFDLAQARSAQEDLIAGAEYL